MEMNKFDRIVWRINGILILGVVVLSLIFIFLGICSSLFWKSRAQHNTNFVVVNEKTKKEDHLCFGGFDQISGKPYLISRIHSCDSDFSYSSSAASSVRNYLFYNEQDGTSSWLSDNHNGRILEKYELSETFDLTKGVENRFLGDSGVNAGFVFVIQTDTNQDETVNDSDKKNVVFTDSGGKEAKVILSDVDRVLSVNQNAVGSVIVFYRKNTENKVLEYNFKDGKITRDVILVGTSL